MTRLRYMSDNALAKARGPRVVRASGSYHCVIRGIFSVATCPPLETGPDCALRVICSSSPRSAMRAKVGARGPQRVFALRQRLISGHRGASGVCCRCRTHGGTDIARSAPAGVICTVAQLRALNAPQRPPAVSAICARRRARRDRLHSRAAMRAESTRRDPPNDDSVHGRDGGVEETHRAIEAELHALACTPTGQHSARGEERSAHQGEGSRNREPRQDEHLRTQF